jgi:hypothetical protein
MFPVFASNNGVYSRPVDGKPFGYFGAGKSSTVQIVGALQMAVSMFVATQFSKVALLATGETLSRTDITRPVDAAVNLVNPADAFLSWIRGVRIDHALAVPFSQRASGRSSAATGNFVSVVNYTSKYQKEYVHEVANPLTFPICVSCLLRAGWFAMAGASGAPAINNPAHG